MAQKMTGGDMKPKVEAILKKLVSMRDDALSFYLTSLEGFSPDLGSNRAVHHAGILHDLDRHITNLELELKRSEVTHA